MTSLLPIVNEYKLHYKDLEFWVPYWINEPGTPEGPLAGKGRPAELQSQLNKLIQEYQDPLKSGEEVRYLMLRNGLGVDCSGMVYYVLDTYLERNYQTNLAKHLVVQRSELLAAMEKSSWQKVAKAEVEGWPDAVPMSQVCERFEKDPIYITNVARLCDEVTSVSVKNGELKIGDMLYLKNVYGGHIAIVAEVNGDSVLCADSRFDPVGPGGIRLSETSRQDPQISPKYKIERICRLKVLDAAE